jgi:para-nitrobenzyl esterase
MARHPRRFCFGSVLLIFSIAGAYAADRVKVSNGTLEGTESSGLREFKGIPFAEPPVGALRWKAPQPPKKWSGVRSAAKFGPRCMQRSVFSDMVFRSDGMGEDCLYLNVWTPAKSGSERLPVLVYFFGGGFTAGDGSESRYDGASMARKDIVAVTVNYRLGIFGFFAHPELTKESPHHASGNYGLLDQNAALLWVKQNIAAFGGDPRKVTIAGESAGSISVSAQMASPLSRDLIAGAIGESGSILGALSAAPLEQVEQQGTKFAATVNAADLAALRAMPADQLMEAAAKPGAGRFSPTIDGYFFPESPFALFAAGKQAHVPLLAGWNSAESDARGVLAREEPTRENFTKAVEHLYHDDASAVLAEYSPASDDEVYQVATDLASDRFIAHSTWKWLELSAANGGKPVYRYYYSRPRPRMVPGKGNAPAARGAAHSAEIEYAMGNLDGNPVYEWTADDRKVSTVMEDYFANFIKKGDPNAQGLPKWPAVKEGPTVQFMHIDVDSRAEAEAHRGRNLVLDRIIAKQMTAAER